MTERRSSTPMDSELNALVDRHSAELQAMKDRPASFDRLVDTVSRQYNELVEFARCARSESGEIERAYQTLGLYGVPRERAKSVANGIDVLATRIQREEGFERMMHADAKRFRWIAAHREKFKAMLADDHKTGDILSAELQEAMEGWNG